MSTCNKGTGKNWNWKSNSPSPIRNKSCYLPFKLELHFKILVLIILLIYYFYFWNSNQTSASIAGTEKSIHKIQIYCSFITPTSNFQVPQRGLTQCRHINRQWCLLYLHWELPPLHLTKRQKSKIKTQKKSAWKFSFFKFDWYTPNIPIFPKNQKKRKKLQI